MSPAQRTKQGSRGHGGFTLVEAVLAMGIAAILLIGMGGALTMSMTALDKGQDKNSAAVKAAAVSDRMLADFDEASTIISRSVSGIGMKVGDRDSDGRPESVAYVWAGAAGTPLYRSMNGGAASILLPKVDLFAIDVLTRASTATTSAEQVLATYDTSVGATVKTQVLNGPQAAAQYVKPAFADNVDSWSITRIQVRVFRVALPTGALRVSIVRAANWQPTGAVLSSVDIVGGSLPASAAWFDVPVSAGPLLPSDGVFILLEGASGLVTGVGNVEYGSGGVPMPYNTYLSISNNAGATWSAAQDTDDMRFIAYGTISTH